LTLLLIPAALCFGLNVDLDLDPQQEYADIEILIPGGALDDPETQGVLAELAAAAVLLKGQDRALFDACGLDLDSSHAVDVRAFDTRIKLHLTDGSKTAPLLEFLLENFAEKSLELREVELARKALLEKSEGLEGHFSPELIAAKNKLLYVLTPSQTSAYATSSWNLAKASLKVGGGFDKEAVKKTIASYGPSLRKVVPQDAAQVSSSTLVIDGKIYMSEPAWYQTRWYGSLFGIAMAITGVGFGILAFVFQPFIGAAAVFSLFTGVYFTAFPYYDDPLVIQEKRKEDLEQGFLHSYKCGRASKTLTPCERRVLFISQNLEYGERYPSKLSGFPIAWLADIYDLQDKVMKEMLYPSEIKELQNLKDEFIIARNQFKHERNQLEDELMSLLKPHQILRDIALDNARKRYEADTFVMALRKLQGELGEHTDSIWELWRQGKISSEERDRMIDDTNAYYKELMNDDFMVEQAKKAREFLELEQERILRNYKDAERNCKNLIKYDERLQNIENGTWGLYARFSDYLVTYIDTLTVYDYETFPDYLDLRK
ncbi:MAG: hypothetical protein KDK48_06170, partial [Chlamydiia bacterium]|nr:hypothetical protein [Chlamydiia bacterium]